MSREENPFRRVDNTLTHSSVWTTAYHTRRGEWNVRSLPPPQLFLSQHRLRFKCLHVGFHGSDEHCTALQLHVKFVVARVNFSGKKLTGIPKPSHWTFQSLWDRSRWRRQRSRSGEQQRASSCCHGRASDAQWKFGKETEPRNYINTEL